MSDMEDLETEGYIIRKEICIPNCPYCGNIHYHRLWGDLRIDDMIHQKIKCRSMNMKYEYRFNELYWITIKSKECIFKKIDEYKKFENLFKLYDKWDVKNWNKFIKSIKILEKYELSKISNDLIKGSNLSEMAVIFQSGNIWDKIKQKINLVYIKEFHINKFPDMVGVRINKDGNLENINIEFESVSFNFVKHKHPSAKCNIIICWNHNWKECSKHIEIIELNSMINKNIN